MSDHIEAILFDVGGTLRGSIKKSRAEKEKGVEEILALLNADVSPSSFAEKLTKRNDDYLTWCRNTHVELDEVELWIKWLLPDWPANQISEHALELNCLWRQAFGDRPVFPETKEVLLELFNRGYRLGIVSNTVSSTETPEVMDDLKLSGCIEVVILSCVEGIRKPNPELFLEATRRMNINPEKCAYIGNKLDRDIDSSRKAGFSKSVILLDPDDKDQITADPAYKPDMYINNLKDLLDIFPPVEVEIKPDQVYQASLSTMWAKKFPSLVEFFEASRRLGFEKVELNHMLDSAILARVNLDDYQISSIHEPCPADISTGELKDQDWLISSPDEVARQKGVEAIQRSIDLAHKIGVKTIVVHAGNITGDLTRENQLRSLFEAGKADTEEFKLLNQTMIGERARLAPPRIEAVKKSLNELLAYAALFNIHLGLENRYHYYDVPTLDEMGDLLKLAGPDKLGFIYDVGHAQTLERLDFFPHKEWLDRYSDRMIGVHLHDVKGVLDHYAPGLGDVDFDMIAPYLPVDAFRTCELQPVNTPEQVKASLKYLEEHGCIKSL
ncbi:MAG: HAD-IA family hydrolase [Anaerolineales bacterium]|nr:HAD-IA family hydrolase [Anaerolineales bacterium]